jgi:hypothetical protein
MISRGVQSISLHLGETHDSSIKKDEAIYILGKILSEI